MCVASVRARVLSCYQVGRDNVVTQGGLLEISQLWDFLVIVCHCIVFFDCIARMASTGIQVKITFFFIQIFIVQLFDVTDVPAYILPRTADI